MVITRLVDNGGLVKIYTMAKLIQTDEAMTGLGFLLRFCLDLPNRCTPQNLVDLTLSSVIFKADDIAFLTRSVQFSLSDSFISYITKFQNLL